MADDTGPAAPDRPGVIDQAADVGNSIQQVLTELQSLRALVETQGQKTDSNATAISNIDAKMDSILNGVPAKLS